jgi:glycosyltransferase involved in cell wall biosynthesis
VDKVLCSVATRGRYHTTLPLVLSAIVNQTRQPDKLIVFDDNDQPEDMRNNPVYQHLFNILDAKGIPWEWRFADKKGQHHIHQQANLEPGFDWVWRVDDDAVPEPNVLEHLMFWTDLHVGAVGGSILTPPLHDNNARVTGKIDVINNEPNIQWSPIKNMYFVEHLHCSFLYRAGVHDYNLGLSRVAHREETLFTYGLHQKGYEVIAVPDAVTWHMKNPQGGIRMENNRELYEHDEQIFKNVLAYRDKTIVVLNSGLGDHIVFSHILPEIPNAEVFSCYPEVVPGRPIAEAQQLFGDIDPWNIYKKMDQWNWNGSLEGAFRKMYL